MIYSMYVVGASDIIFSHEHYIGLILILVSWCLLQRDLPNRIATFLALLLGTFNQAAFTPTITTYTIGFTIEGKGLDITIQLYCLLLLTLFIILNRNVLRKFLNAL